MFRSLIHRWFDSVSSDYNDFIEALLTDDLKAMNVYMNKVALSLELSDPRGIKNKTEKFLQN